MGQLRKLRVAIAREGLLRTSERAWDKLFSWVATGRLTHLLGRCRNLFRLPALRRRHRAGKLNLGCGPDRREGWLNADLGLTGDLHLNVSRPFPFPDSFFALIFAEHLLEHLTEAAAAACLRECYRVLQPGGILRLSTPDLRQVVNEYLAPPDQTESSRAASALASPWKYGPGQIPSPAQALNDGFYLWEHRHLYDTSDLTKALAEAGFVQVTCPRPGEGGSPLTAGLERRLEEGSLVVEARKPVA